jgi:hypothetical protein
MLLGLRITMTHQNHNHQTITNHISIIIRVRDGNHIELL